MTVDREFYQMYIFALTRMSIATKKARIAAVVAVISIFNLMILGQNFLSGLLAYGGILISIMNIFQYFTMSEQLSGLEVDHLSKIQFPKRSVVIEITDSEVKYNEGDEELFNAIYKRNQPFKVFCENSEIGFFNQQFSPQGESKYYVIEADATYLIPDTDEGNQYILNHVHVTDYKEKELN